MYDTDKQMFKAKLFLAYLRDWSPESQITSVSFADKQYKNLSKLQFSSIDAQNREALESLADSIGAGVVPENAKSDVYINGIGCILKPDPAPHKVLFGKIARNGFERICGVTQSDIGVLDGIADSFFQSLNSGLIKEVVGAADKNSPFKQYKQYMRRIIDYLMFTGDGEGDSPYPAEMYLEFPDPIDLVTWKFIKKFDVFDRVWDKIIFSVKKEDGEGNYSISAKLEW